MMSARISQKSYSPMPDQSGRKGNKSFLFDKSAEGVLKRREKAQLFRSLRLSSMNNTMGRIDSKNMHGVPEGQYEKCTSDVIHIKSKILEEINLSNDKTLKPLIGPILSFSSRKRNLTYTVNQKKSLPSLKFEHDSKQNLNFNKQRNGEDNIKSNNFEYNSRENDYKENITQVLSPVELTLMKVEGSMLKDASNRIVEISKQAKSKENPESVSTNLLMNRSNFLYKKRNQKENEASEGNINARKFRSQLPLLKRSSYTALNSTLIYSNDINEANKSQIARRSMSAISGIQNNTYPSFAKAFTEADDLPETFSSEFASFDKPSTIVIKVTKPSLSSDKQSEPSATPSDENCMNIMKKIVVSADKLHLSSSLDSAEQKKENNDTNKNILNAGLEKNVDKIMTKEKDLPMNIKQSVFPDCIMQDNKNYNAGSHFINTQPSSYLTDNIVKNIQETMIQIAQDRMQINVAMEEINMIVQTKTKAIIERFESSLQPIENLVKLLMEKLIANKEGNNAMEASDVAGSNNTLACFEESFKNSDYMFLGTPMPTKKKRFARSLSHPQIFIKSQSLKKNIQHSIKKSNSADDKNSSCSTEELSPFTNLVGDCERPSLAPMTPKTRNNLFSLKENLNQQLDLLFD